MGWCRTRITRLRRGTEDALSGLRMGRLRGKSARSHDSTRAGNHGLRELRDSAGRAWPIRRSPVSRVKGRVRQNGRVRVRAVDTRKETGFARILPLHTENRSCGNSTGRRQPPDCFARWHGTFPLRVAQTESLSPARPTPNWAAPGNRRQAVSVSLRYPLLLGGSIRYSGGRAGAGYLIAFLTILARTASARSIPV